MRIILRLSICLCLFLSSFGLSANSCLNPEKIKEIRELQKEQSLLTAKTDKGTSPALFQLQKEFDELTAQAAIFKGMRAMKKKYLDYKKQIKRWDEESGTSLREISDLGETLQFMKENQENMTKMLVLEDILQDMLSSDGIDKVNFEEAKGLFETLELRCKDLDYPYIKKPICNHVLEEAASGSIFRGPIRKMLDGFSAAYGKISSFKKGESPNSKTMASLIDDRKDDIKDFHAYLTSNSEKFADILAVDESKAAELKEKLDATLTSYEQKLNDSKYSRSALDAYYQCLAIGAEGINCAERLPKYPLLEGDKTALVLSKFGQDHAMVDEAVQSSLLAKIERNAEAAKEDKSKVSFKQLKKQFEKTISVNLNSMANSNIDKIDDFFTSAYNSSEALKPGDKPNAVAKRDPAAYKKLLDLTNGFFAQANCGNEIALTSSQTISKVELDDQKLLECFDKLDDRDLRGKLSAINKKLDKKKEQILAITGNPQGKFKQLELLKHFLIDEMSAYCQHTLEKEKEKTNTIMHLVSCQRNIENPLKGVDVLVDNVGNVIAQVDKNLLNRRKVRDNARSTEFAKLGESCHLMLSSGVRVRDKYPELCRKFQIARDNALRENFNNQQSSKKRREKTEIKNNHTEGIGAAIFSSTVKHGVDVGLTYMTASSAADYAENQVPNVINQIQYNHSLSQATLEYGFDQFGNINFPSTFTNGLNGVPGGTNFFNGLPIFFGMPTIGGGTGLIFPTGGQVIPSAQVPGSYYYGF